MFPTPPMPGVVPGDATHVHTGAAPVGSVIAYAGTILPPVANIPDPLVPPAGTGTFSWLVCDGSLQKRAAYPMLFHVIGLQYSPDGVADDLFCLPDYRGYFLRMMDLGTSIDPDASSRKLFNGSTSDGVGSIQQDTLQIHEHVYAQPGKPSSPAGQGASPAVILVTDQLSSTPTDSLASLPGGVRVSTETRAKNMYVYYLIRSL